MSASPVFSNLQNAIDFLAKRRDEPSQRSDDGARFGGSYSADLYERVGNIERAMIHVLTRLDRAEAPRRSDKGSSNDEMYNSMERMLREVMTELQKQQNLIEKLSQENAALKGGKVPSSSHTQHTQHIQHAQPVSQAPKPSAIQHVKTTPIASKPPTQQPQQQQQQQQPLQPRKAPTPSKQSSHFDESEAEKKLPVEFPAGYNPHRGRRFSVAGESYNPNTDFKNVQRTIIKKPTEARNRIRSVITNNMLFKNLDDEQLDELIDEMFEVRLKPDEIIIRQGDDGDNFYVVDNGELYVLYKDVVVATIGVGKGFGEIALMYMCPRTATVKAKTECILWGMSRATFRRSLMVHAIRKRELYESFLARVPLLTELLPYERSIIADALESRAYKDGEYIIKEGDKGDAFYIIEKGRVSVTKGNPPVEVKSSSEGEYFGELALLTDQPRAANVSAVGLVRVLYVRREDFSALMGPCEEILKRNTQIYNQINAKLVKAESKAKPQSLQALAAEVLRDETSYVQGLQLTIKEFLVPMRKASEAKKLPITPEEVAHLFSNIEMVANIHNLILDKLNQNNDPSAIGKIFNEAASGLKFNNFSKEWSEISRVYEQFKNDDEMQTFLKAPSRAQGDLYELLRASRERNPTIIGFLKDFLSFVPNDQAAITAIQKLERE